MHQHRILEDTVYFWFASNDTSGSGGDGASPVYDVRLAGAAAGAIPVLSGSATLLSHANYPPGCHEVAIAATSGNGFSAGNTYAVFCTLAVDGQNPSGFVGAFSLEPIIADLREMGGVEQSLTDFKDFADDGYDPATHKVEGVKTVDTNTDMRGTDNAATASALSTHDGKLDTVDTVVDAIKAITDVLVIKKNTEFANFPISMVLSSDHASPGIGKTVTVQRSIDGGAFDNCSNTPATEVSDGSYEITLSAADLNGSRSVMLQISAPDCDTYFIALLLGP